LGGSVVLLCSGLFFRLGFWFFIVGGSGLSSGGCFWCFRGYFWGGVCSVVFSGFFFLVFSFFFFFTFMGCGVFFCSFLCFRGVWGCRGRGGLVSVFGRVFVFFLVFGGRLFCFFLVSCIGEVGVSCCGSWVLGCFFF